MNNSEAPNIPQSSEKKSISVNLLAAGLRYKTAIIGAIIVILIAAGGGYFWMKQMESNEAKASLVLSAIMPVMDSGDFQKAVDGEKTMPGLKEIVSKYGNTPSGNMARLFLASAYYSLNKPDAALAMYGSFSNKNKDLEAAALAGTGACHTQLKQFATAADDYQNASAKAENETLKGQYLNKSADNRLLAGDSVKAKAVYNDVIKQFAGTSAAAVAQRSLWRLEGSETATNH